MVNYSKFLPVGICLFVSTSIIGVFIIGMAYDEVDVGYTGIINFFIWIFGIVLIIKAAKARSKVKYIKKQTHDDEIQILKDKVEKLEKEKEKKD